MAGLKDYTAEELDGELLDLHATNKLLNTNNLQGADGFLENLRQRGLLLKDQEKLERLIERWILDPSSFINPDGDENKVFLIKKRFKILIFIN